MTQYAHLDLGPHMHNFKRNETRKYRDGVCRSLECKFAPIDPDGNCFFAAVSIAMAHFFDKPLSITAQDLRARVVAWLIDCKVRALPPTTTTHHHSDTPPSTIHHHTPLHHHLRAITQQLLKAIHHFTPHYYRTERMEMLGKHAAYRWLMSWRTNWFGLLETRERQYR